MPFSGAAGAKVYTRTNGVHTGSTQWQQDEAAGTGIVSNRHDTADQDLATAVSTSWQINGDNSLTAVLPTGGFGFSGLGTLSSATEVNVTAAATSNVLAAASLQVLCTGAGATITSLGTTAKVASKRVRFDGINTLTHNATSLILPGAANIVTASGDRMEVESDASGNARVTWYQRASGASISAALANTGLTGQLFGLSLSNDSGGSTAIAISAGTARDSTDVDTMVLASALTGKVLGTAWSVGNAGGFLDTGAVANTTYHIYLIKRTDTGVVDAVASTSASAPTLPTNYTLYRRIGSIVRSGGSIRGFRQDGDYFRWLLGIQDVSATNPGITAVTRTLSVPVGIVVWADIIVWQLSATSGQGVALITALDETDTAPADAIFNSYSLGTGATACSSLSIKTNTSAQVRSRIQTSGAGDKLIINTFGWRDTRGRLA